MRSGRRNLRRLTLTPPAFGDVLDEAAVERIRAAVRDAVAEPTSTSSASLSGGGANSALACE